jgi:hypothetical protein
LKYGANGGTIQYKAVFAQRCGSITVRIKASEKHSGTQSSLDRKEQLYMKRFGLMARMVCGIVGLAMGIALIASDGAAVMSFLTKLIGLFMLVINAPRIILFFTVGRKTMGKIEVAGALSGGIIGLIVFLLPAAAVSVGAVIAGIWFVILPVWDIAMSQYKKEQMKAELPKLIVGAALILLGPTALFSFMIKIFGAFVVAAASFYLLRLLLKSN